MLDLQKSIAPDSTSLGQNSINAPSIAIYNNKMYLAWREEGTNKLKVICSEDNGQTWGTPIDTGQKSNASPSIAVFGTFMYMAFSDTSNNLKVCFTLEGVRWFQATDTGRNTKTGPSICSFKGKLYITWSGVNSSDVKVISSTDGTSWSPFVNTERHTAHDPSICAFNGKLFISWTGINSKKVKVISSTDGQTWTPFVETGQYSDSSPSLVMTNKLLTIGFKRKDSNELRYITSSDGVEWSNAAAIGESSSQGPTIVSYASNLYWSFTAANGSALQFIDTGEVPIEANQKIPLYRDSTAAHSKLHFKLYFDYQMDNEILVHPDTGDFHFNLQAQDLQIGVNQDLARCNDTLGCDWSSINFNSDFEGSCIPVKSHDLPLDHDGICGWSCTCSGTDHSRFFKKTSLSSICLNTSTNQYPNIPCGLMGYVFSTQAAAPNNWNQLGMGYPGRYEEAFFNQLDYQTYHMAIDGDAYIRQQMGISIGYWGLDLAVENKTTLLSNVPFYVKNHTPSEEAGTRQLKLKISSNAISDPHFVPVHFDTGTPNSYRLMATADHDHLFNQIANYFLGLAEDKNDSVSEGMIRAWKNGPLGEFLMVKTSLLKDASGNFIDLPFEFETAPTVPLFSKDYYIKNTNATDTITYFLKSKKNVFGLPFFLNRELVFTDNPTNNGTHSASIYSFQN